jgi:quinol monooxygenase YgiN
MTEVYVIARSVARGGRENQLRELLRGMLAPTRAESGCKLYELYESDSKGRFYFYEIWGVKLRSINTQPALTLSTWSRLSAN